jgi:two-component system OmpR family sensor kinase/two-component system sensor histidine kinase BaeS
MNKLWIHLTLAFSLITITGVLVVALLANRQVNTDFRSFMAESQVQDSLLLSELSDYYALHASWDGVEQLLADIAAPRRGMAGRGGPVMILSDQAGDVVYSSAATQLGTRIARADLAQAIPIRVDNTVAGYLLVSTGAGAAISPAGQQFLARVNNSLLQAGLLAGGLGLLLGVVIARSLAAPLSRLSDAARQIAQGKRDLRLPVAGASEIADVARAFNEMAAGLQQSERLRQHMIADVAHELRTPLTVIQGNLRAILDDVYALEKREIATIYDETLLLSRLMNDLRELALAESGQLALNPQPVAVEPIISRVIAFFEAAASAQGVALVKDIPGPLPAASIDADRVHQVLHNLVANALRYTPPGGQITIAAVDEPDGGRNGPDHASFVTFTVRDTGTGIAAADLPHVFERFWRADQSRSRQQGGSGLGLAIARQIVELHGGQIGVTSQVGVGSEFWFRLPVAGKQAREYVPQTA